MTKPKRKVDFHLEAKEPENKILKTEDDTLNKKKVSLQNMKKADLVSYCKELEDLKNKLEIEKNTLIEENKILELRNKALQQSEEKFTYSCGDCDYESDCVHCFSDHDHEPEDSNDEVIRDSNFNCYYCDEIFPTKATVMTHTKISHVDKAKHCLNFLEGTCSYNDNCWFLHDQKVRESDPGFNCNYCDRRFKTKIQLMRHKKQDHIQNVARCSNENKNCKFGFENCWFLHTENIEKAYESETNVNKNIKGAYPKNDT